jgi:mannose-6-phosphate isomerase-like protein (cupin superfamily)
MDYITPAGFAGPLLHIHERTNEAFYVLDGALTIDRDGEIARAEAESHIFVARGTAHTFSNPDSVPAKFLVVMTPGGYEGNFEAMAADTLPEVLVGKFDQRRVG